MENKMENLKAEDSTKYGEFISSFDRWLTFEEQKKQSSSFRKQHKNRWKRIKFA